MSKIRLHGSSSGYTEIAPVAASGNNTLTLPNDGTIISKDSNGAVGVTSITVGTGVTIGDGRITCSTVHGSAASLTQIPAANIVGVCTSGLTKTGGFGGGKLLQVVQNSTTTRLATSSSSFVASSHLVTITPTEASSKIFITHTGEANSQSSGNHVYITVYRSINGGTYEEIAPHGSVTNQGMSVIRSADARLQVPFSINYLDSPTYTVGNSITYKLYVRCPEGNLIEIPSSDDSNAIVNIAREIAA